MIFVIWYLLYQTLHSLCHIAEGLLHHQQIGNVHYSGWRLLVPCCSRKEADLQEFSIEAESQHEKLKEDISLVRKDMVNRLQELAKEMECQLDVWRESINLARNKYYELNYYTTAQLLNLRRNLGIFKDYNNDLAIPSDVMALLQCIHPQVDRSIVKQSVCISLSKTVNSEVDKSSDAFGMKSEKHNPLTRECRSQHIKIKTPSSKPPIISSLTESQKATVAHVIKRLHCSQSLVLKAFEALDYEHHQNHDYFKWCSMNADLDYSDDSEHSDSGSEVMEDIEADVSDEEMSYTAGINII